MHVVQAGLPQSLSQSAHLYSHGYSHLFRDRPWSETVESEQVRTVCKSYSNKYALLFPAGHEADPILRTNCDSLPRTFLAFKLKVECPGNPLCLRQTRVVVHPGCEGWSCCNHVATIWNPKMKSAQRKLLRDGETSVPSQVFKPLDLARPVARSPRNLSL